MNETLESKVCASIHQERWIELIKMIETAFTPQEADALIEELFACALSRRNKQNKAGKAADVLSTRVRS